jgi:hypothetical protein
MSCSSLRLGSRDYCACAGSFGKLPGARIDLHGRRHPGGQDDALGT